jgi:origin recognition complex subunit 1
VVDVSNTLNVPERLHPRTQSRWADLRCFFKAYASDQITAILRIKLYEASPNYEVFKQDAIEYASKKTASHSGDLRRAFHISREAAENVWSEVGKEEITARLPAVQIEDDLKVSQQSSRSTRAKALALCSHFGILLIVPLVSLAKMAGREQGGFDMEELVGQNGSNGQCNRYTGLNKWLSYCGIFWVQ